MKRYIWLIVFLGAVILHANQRSFVGALGYSIPWFVLGMAFSPIWWVVTKFKRTSPWQWPDWLNAGSYMMIILLVLNVVVHAYIQV